MKAKDAIVCAIGIKLTERADRDLHNTKTPTSFKLLVFDVAQLQPSVKHMQVVGTYFLSMLILGASYLHASTRLDFSNMQALFLGGVKAEDSATADRYFSLALDTLKASPHISVRTKSIELKCH